MKHRQVGRREDIRTSDVVADLVQVVVVGGEVEQHAHVEQWALQRAAADRVVSTKVARVTPGCRDLLPKTKVIKYCQTILNENRGLTAPSG